MGKEVTIDFVEVCDSDKNPLPKDANGFYIVTFSPAPLGTAGTLNLRVICTLDPNEQTQIAFRLVNLNKEDYMFTMGNNNEIQYIRETASDVQVFLPFEVRNMKPFVGPDKALPLPLRLFARDTEPNSPSPTSDIVTIIGKN